MVNRYQYNGIELLDDWGLNLNTARYRTLDPQLGRWWQIDPEVEQFEAWSAYNSNLDNPIRYEDKEGDCPICLAVGIAFAVDYGMQSYKNYKENGGNFKEAINPKNIDKVSLGISAGTALYGGTAVKMLGKFAGPAITTADKAVAPLVKGTVAAGGSVLKSAFAPSKKENGKAPSTEKVIKEAAKTGVQTTATSAATDKGKEVVKKVITKK